MIYDNRDPNTTTVRTVANVDIDVNPTRLFRNMYINQHWQQVADPAFAIHEAVVDSIEQLDDHLDGADYFHVIVLASKGDAILMDVMNVQQGYVKSHAVIETKE